MQQVILTLLFHLFCIILFTSIYAVMANKHMILHDKSLPKFIDCLMLGITIQATIGYSHIYPSSNLAKMVIIFQQIIVICTNVFMLYFIIIMDKGLREPTVPLRPLPSKQPIKGTN